MHPGSKSQFDAETVARLIGARSDGRLEIELIDAAGACHVVSLPFGAATSMARLICDAADATPFLGNRAPSG